MKLEEKIKLFDEPSAAHLTNHLTKMDWIKKLILTHGMCYVENTRPKPKFNATIEKILPIIVVIVGVTAAISLIWSLVLLFPNNTTSTSTIHMERAPKYNTVPLVPNNTINTSTTSTDSTPVATEPTYNDTLGNISGNFISDVGVIVQDFIEPFIKNNENLQKSFKLGNLSEYREKVVDRVNQFISPVADQVQKLLDKSANLTEYVVSHVQKWFSEKTKAMDNLDTTLNLLSKFVNRSK